MDHKLLDLKNNEDESFNLSFEVSNLDKYEDLKNQLKICGKVQKSSLFLSSFYCFILKFYTQILTDSGHRKTQGHIIN